jgi:CHAT domain-containing protein
MFLASGACGVIGTFWHTDDMATLLLMLRFYSLWCDGGFDPDTALGEAQAWLMSSSADTLRKALPSGALEQPAAAMLKSASDDAIPYHHPWFWSSFFFAGA